MKSLPALPGRAVITALERAGFEVIRTKGSHHFLRHRNDPGRQTVVPVHRNDLPAWHTSRNIAASTPQPSPVPRSSLSEPR